MSTLDKEYLELLTPEEREAVEDKEFSETELAAMKGLASDEGEDDDLDNDSGDGVTDVVAKEPAKEPAKKPEPETPEAPAAAKQDAAESQTEQAPAMVPVYKAALPEDFEAKTTALTTQENEAWEKFEDGDLDKAALQTQLRAIETQRSELNAAKLKSEIASEMTEQQQATANEQTISTFLSKNKSAGVDYTADKTGMWEELRGFVQVLENKPENAGKPLDWFLTEGHKRVLALRGIAPTPTPKTKEQTLKEATDKRKQNVEGAPKTLAQVPGGEGPGDVGDEFADIDALDGEALEAAIKRMPKEVRDRYLASA